MFYFFKTYEKSTNTNDDSLISEETPTASSAQDNIDVDANNNKIEAIEELKELDVEGNEKPTSQSVRFN